MPELGEITQVVLPPPSSLSSSASKESLSSRLNPMQNVVLETIISVNMSTAKRMQRLRCLLFKTWVTLLLLHRAIRVRNDISENCASSDTMSENVCDPVYGKVDDLLELLTKSKALHVLLELHLANRNLSFTDLKRRVDSASTTVSRRLTELEHSGFIEKKSDEFNSKSAYYSLTDKSRTLAPVIQSMYDWCKVN